MIESASEEEFLRRLIVVGRDLNHPYDSPYCWIHRLARQMKPLCPDRVELEVYLIIHGS